MSINQNIPQLISRFVFFLIAALFLGYQFKYAINAPYAPDDARMFLSQFMDKYIEGDSFIDKIILLVYNYNECNVRRMIQLLIN